MLNLGQTDFKQVTHDQIRPGDIICTYEGVITNRTNANAIQAQSILSWGSNMAKLLHYEIVVGTTRQPSVVRVVHASGQDKRVVEEVQDLSKFSLGTAIVVLRPRNEQLAGEIVNVARRTKDGANPWKIKGITDDKGVARTLMKRVPLEKHLQKLARMAVDGDSFFRNKKGEAKAMSCAQYISAVVSSSTLRQNSEIRRILDAQDLSREEKIEFIIAYLREKRIDTLMPGAGLFHSNVTSVNLMQKFLGSPEVWEPVGYVGTNPEPLIHTPASVRMHPRSFKVEHLGSLGIGSQKKVQKVFSRLDLLSEKMDYLQGYNFEKRIKLEAAFYYMQVKKKGLDQGIMREFLLRANSFERGNQLLVDYQNFEYGRTLRNEAARKRIFLTKQQDLPPFYKKVFMDGTLQDYLDLREEYRAFASDMTEIENGTVDLKEDQAKEGFFSDLFYRADPAEILEFERAVIKREEPKLERREFVYMSTTNVNKKSLLSQSRMYRIAAAVALVAVAVIACYNPYAALAFFAVSMALLAYRYRVQRRELIHEINRTANTLANDYETLRLNLQANAGFGNRMWVKFSADGGQHWDIRPAVHLGDDRWELRLKAKGELTYQVFSGPWDVYAENPEENARFFNGEGDRISLEEIEKLQKDENGRFVLNYPNLRNAA